MKSILQSIYIYKNTEMDQYLVSCCKQGQVFYSKPAKKYKPVGK